MAKKSVEKTVGEIAKDFLIENELELYNVEFKKEGSDRFLRVYIDHKWEPGTDSDSVPGIGTDECEKVSRYLSEILDKTSLINGAYILEVSSPGMDRPLLNHKHFKRYEGKDADISLYKAIDGRKKISGKLGKLENDILEVTTEGGIVLRLPMKSIAKTKLKVVI